MKEDYFVIDGQSFTLSDVQQIIETKPKLVLGDNAKRAITKSYDFLKSKLSYEHEVFYGINTGFGSLCDTIISKNHLQELQRNLVVSHAAGVGNHLSQDEVACMLLTKAIALSLGYSGVQLETVELILSFFNHQIYPCIPEQGSLGASGDLAPLGHLALALIGEGNVTFDGKEMLSSEAMNLCGLRAVKLQAKEGLALLNGTQFMISLGVLNYLKAALLLEKSLQIAAMSVDAFMAKSEPFHPKLQLIRNQKGQIWAAQKMREILHDSSIFQLEKTHVQDPYSFRCIPQVFGAVKDCLDNVAEIFTRELNAVTDNPTILPDEGMIISGGNFHGQPLAYALDFLKIVMADLGSFSERRTYKMLSGQRQLPAFLVAKPGLNSGFMIAQYTAASLVSQNKQLAAPCSVDTIDSSNGQEDHVSMGANAALSLRKIMDNLSDILAIELLVAGQALDFRRPLKGASKVEDLHSQLRSKVAFMENDNFMSKNISDSKKVLLNKVKR